MAGLTPGHSASSITLDKLFTHIRLLTSSLIWCDSHGSDTCSWECEHRSAIALAMCHRLKWFINLWAWRLRMGNKHLTFVTSWRMVLFTLPFYGRGISCLPNTLILLNKKLINQLLSLFLNLAKFQFGTTNYSLVCIVIIHMTDIVTEEWRVPCTVQLRLVHCRL